MKIELYGDGIGSVDYVSHMGSDLTVVNSARVSFGVEKNELDEKDLGSLKALVSQGKTDIYNTLNKILESEIT